MNKLVAGIVAVVLTSVIGSPAVAINRSTEVGTLGLAVGARAGIQPVGLGLSTGANVGHMICVPRPDADYVGCTYAQTLPYSISRFNLELRGNANIGYDYYRMGQHPRHHVIASITPALNAHLASVYSSSVSRFHSSTGRYPMFLHWSVYKTWITAACIHNKMSDEFPSGYCHWTGGDSLSSVLWNVTKFLFSCDGDVVGGFTSGGIIAGAKAAVKFSAGTMLKGGGWGALAGTTYCVSKDLYMWGVHGQQPGRSL